jgi:hypothetical protein
VWETRNRVEKLAHNNKGLTFLWSTTQTSDNTGNQTKLNKRLMTFDPSLIWKSAGSRGLGRTGKQANNHQRGEHYLNNRKRHVTQPIQHTLLNGTIEVAKRLISTSDKRLSSGPSASGTLSA